MKSKKPKPPKQLPSYKWGEFVCVAKAVKHKRYLRKAHKTGCSQIEAINILKILFNTFCPEYKLCLAFGGSNKGGFGGYTGGNEGQEKLGYMELPKLQLRKSKMPHRKLRIGIVMHEFSHVYDMWKMDDAQAARYLKNKGGHGKKFAITFDKVLNFFYTKAVKWNHKKKFDFPIKNYYPIILCKPYCKETNLIERI